MNRAFNVYNIACQTLNTILFIVGKSPATIFLATFMFACFSENAIPAISQGMLKFSSVPE